MSIYPNIARRIEALNKLMSATGGRVDGVETYFFRSTLGELND
jgi:hypothetical protein